MAAKLTDEQIKLLKEPQFAQLATLMPDGSPHVSPVWVDTDGEYVLVNTEEQRVKVRNMEQDPRVAISVYDPAEPYTRVVNVRGRVVEITKEGATDHINDLAEQYMGKRPYPYLNPELSRLIVKIEPEHVSSG